MKNICKRVFALVIIMVTIFSGISINIRAYAETQDDRQDTQICSDISGNTDIQVENYSANAVQCKESDFIGAWEGEYIGSRGEEDASGKIVRAWKVPRHVIFYVTSCKVYDGHIASIEGYASVSLSDRAEKKDGYIGSYRFSGNAILSTGYMELRGHTWINQPTGRVDWPLFAGYINSGKNIWKGNLSDVLNGEFEVCKIGNYGRNQPRVIMNWNERSYDLGKDYVSIPENSEDKVSVIVSPTWYGETPGSIILYQDDTSLQSTTGIFSQIMPGKNFKPSKEIKMSLINAQGKIIYTRNLTLSISPRESDRASENTDTTRLTVYQNKNTGNHVNNRYILCKDATVSSEKETVKTDLNGNALLQTIKSGSITVSKDGFVPRTFSAERLKYMSNVYLQPITDTTPVISGVWLGNQDVLNESYPLNRISKEYISLYAEINWGSASSGKVELIQENRGLEFDGETLSLILSDKFDTNEEIYIRATDNRGRSSKKKLLFENAVSSKAASALNGASLNMGNNISLNLPDTVKPEFFAGMNVGAGLNAVIPVSISVSDGMFIAVFGLDVGKMTYDKNKNNSIEIKKIKDQIKDIKNSRVDIEKKIKKIKELKKGNSDFIQTQNGKFGFDADITILGYAEGTYDAEGKLVLQDGGILMNPSVNLEKSWPFMAGPLPMFFETELNADALSQLQVIFNEQAKNFTASGLTTGTISLSGGLGAGVRNILYMSGGLTGSLSPSLRTYADTSSYFRLTASVNAYAKAGLACFVAERKFDITRNNILVDTSKSSTQSSSVYDGSEDEIDFFNSDSYELKDLSYVEKKSEFLANDRSDTEVMSTDSGKSDVETQIFNTNIYQESVPQIVSFGDNKKLAVWQDTKVKICDEICLYYSYYNGTIWTEPRKVIEDGTMDCQPYLTVISEKPYVIWQNATRTFMDLFTLSPDSIKSYFDIAVGAFHEDTDTFSISTISNPGLDMMPCITGLDEETLYAVWINGTDWFGNGTNSILSSKWNGTSWSIPKQEMSGENAITSVAADYDGKLKWAASVDTDGNIYSTGDIRVMENGAYVSESSYAQTDPSYLDHDLYWYSNKNVVNRKMDATEGCINPAQYQLLMVNGRRALVYTESDGFASFVKASYFDDFLQKWGEGKVLKESDEFVGALGATVDAKQNYSLLLNATTIKINAMMSKDDPYEDSTLKLLTISPYCDLTLEEIDYRDDTFCVGSNMKFTLSVKNNGTKDVAGVNVRIRDASGNLLYESVYDHAIVAGDVVNINTSYLVTEEISSQKVSISITPKGEKDSHSQDNIKWVTLKYEDVAVENIGWGTRSDGKTAITADIVNRGYTKQTDLSVSLHKGSADGTVVETKKISTLEGMDLENLTFVVAAQKNDVYYVVINSREDDCTANNQDFIVILDDDAVEPGVENGLWHDGEQFVYYKNGEPDASYIGFVEYQNEWYYVKKGTVADTGFNQSGEDVVYATINGKTGWYYTNQGKADFDHLGFVRNGLGWYYIKKGMAADTGFNQSGEDVVYGTIDGKTGWYYTNQGKADFSHTGFVRNGLGWYYVKNGIGQDTGFQQSGKDIVYGTINGKTDWYYTDQGRVDFSYTGFAQNGNGWFYVENGTVPLNRDDIIHGTVNGKTGWWYIQYNKVMFTTTIDKNANGWWYVRDGMVDFDYTGFGNNANGWWYVEDGKVTFKKNSVIHGVVNNVDGWWYVVESKVTFKDTVAQNENGWWRIKNGKVDFSYTGIAQNDYGWWRIENGKVNLNFTGVAQNENGWWYVKNGKVDMNYSGKVTYNGKTYTIKNGKVVSTASDEEPDDDAIIYPTGIGGSGQDGEPAVQSDENAYQLDKAV